VKIVHCPTEEMWANLPTKPLQGKARMMQAKLMSCDVEYEEKETEIGKAGANQNQTTNSKTSPVRGGMTKQGPTRPLQECVGGSQNRGQTRATDRQSVGVSRIQGR
jgi:hypothetical protein